MHDNSLRWHLVHDAGFFQEVGYNITPFDFVPIVKIHFHPLVNDLTIALKLDALDPFFKFTGHEAQFISL